MARLMLFQAFIAELMKCNQQLTIPQFTNNSEWSPDGVHFAYETVMRAWMATVTVPIASDVRDSAAYW